MKYKGHLILLLALIILLIGSLAGCTPEEPGASRTFRTHKDRSNGFSVSYPRNWKKVPEENLTGMKIVAFWNQEDKGKPVFTLAKDNQTAETSSQGYFEEMEETIELAKPLNYSSISKGEVVVDGVPAIKHVFIFSGEGETLAAMQVFVAQAKSVWIMSFICTSEYFDSWEPTFDAIVSSFHLY